MMHSFSIENLAQLEEIAELYTGRIEKLIYILIGISAAALILSIWNLLKKK